LKIDKLNLNIEHSGGMLLTAIRSTLKEVFVRDTLSTTWNGLCRNSELCAQRLQGMARPDIFFI